MPPKVRQLIELGRQPERFTLTLNNIQLHPYQLKPLQAIWSSIREHRGDSFVLIFSRQSGKDELLANLIVYVLSRLYRQEASIVCAQTTFQPQAQHAMDRLESRLNRPWFKKRFKHADGYKYRFNRAICTYLSAEPTANVVGATARTLLIINETQDVSAAVYDKKFAPMATSGNATHIFSGTSWASNTLLARELCSASLAEKSDGRERVFIATGEEVSRSNPYYAAFMQNEIFKLGRDHPLIRSQYFCEEIDAQRSMFTSTRLALMQADQPSQDSPCAGVASSDPTPYRRHESPVPVQPYAFLIDLAGQDEARMNLGSDAPLENPGQDSVSLSIVSVDLSTLETLQAPTYRVVSRKQWKGLNHLSVFGQVKALGDVWQPQYFVVDATGVGRVSGRCWTGFFPPG